MSNIIEKLSTYNLFNYLFPGVIFCLIADNYFSYPLIQNDIILGLFLYYFVGLVISRIGSLIIEPILKKIGFVKYSDYSDFVSASKKDTKIDILLEVNNMYRTIIALFASLILIVCYETLKASFPEVASYIKYMTIIIFLVMFLLSYRKQTNYINERVKISKE